MLVHFVLGNISAQPIRTYRFKGYLIRIGLKSIPSIEDMTMFDGKLYCVVGRHLNYDDNVVWVILELTPSEEN